MFTELKPDQNFSQIYYLHRTTSTSSVSILLVMTFPFILYKSIAKLYIFIFFLVHSILNSKCVDVCVRVRNIKSFFNYVKTSLLDVEFLFFTVHPVINVRNQLVGSPFEKDVTIECNVEASPKSINYWIKDVKDGKF